MLGFCLLVAIALAGCGAGGELQVNFGETVYGTYVIASGELTYSFSMDSKDYVLTMTQVD